MTESNGFQASSVTDEPTDSELRLLAKIDALSADLREWRRAAMEHGATVRELTELLTKYGVARDDH